MVLSEVVQFQEAAEMNDCWGLDPLVRDADVADSISPRRIRVLIADDHRLFAEALIVGLGTDDRVDVVGHALDGWQTLELAAELEPDVILMDFDMPRLDGVETTYRLRHVLPDASVVMLSASAAAENMLRATEAGASLYLTKACGMGEVLASVLEVVRHPVEWVVPRWEGIELRQRQRLGG